MTQLRPIINPAMLIWARATARRSMDDIAKACEVQINIVASWEAGTAFPTIAQLKDIAKQCRRPLAALFLPEPPIDKDVPRGLRSLGSKGPDTFTSPTAFAVRTALRCSDVAKDLYEEFSLTPSNHLPHFSRNDDPEALGGLFRESLGIDVATQMKWKESEALTVWRSLIEKLGILTLQLTFPLDEGRGFSIYDQVAPAIVINSQDVETARCFTLFHEIAHLGLRKSGIFQSGRLFGGLTSTERQEEFFCNHFAGAVLVPSSSSVVQEKLAACIPGGNLDENALARLARELKVSRFVILRRLWSLDMTDLETLQATESRWSAAFHNKPKKKGGAPVPQATLCIKRRGQRFIGMVMEGLDREVISYAQASDYLGLKTKHFSELRGGGISYDI